MKIVFLAFAVCLLLFACNKTDSTSKSLFPCNTLERLDSGATVAKLIGSWQWEKQQLPSNGAIVSAAKNVTVRFKPDFTFTVKEAATVTAQGTWELYPFTIDGWSLNLSSPSNYLYGQISFCNNQVTFVNSYVDGSNNLFIRQE